MAIVDQIVVYTKSFEGNIRQILLRKSFVADDGLPHKRQRWQANTETACV